jgi:hypothetical protein
VARRNDKIPRRDRPLWGSTRFFGLPCVEGIVSGIAGPLDVFRSAELVLAVWLDAYEEGEKPTCVVHAFRGGSGSHFQETAERSVEVPLTRGADERYFSGTITIHVPGGFWWRVVCRWGAGKGREWGSEEFTTAHPVDGTERFEVRWVPG